MGETAIQGFYKGMNKDSAKNKYDPNSYIDASNWRVVTDYGLSSGSLENEKGNTLSFKIPDVPEITLTNGDVIPIQTDLKIMGFGSMLDTIIICTTNETSATPGSSIGQIWACKFDESTNAIIGLDINGYLDPNIHLKYNNVLGFSTYHTVKRIIGRYENTKTQRIYFTDYYNNVKTLNIADTDSLNIDPGLLDLATDAQLSQPQPISIGDGSLPSGTVIQFSYRLLSSSGAESLYAPCSVLYPLSKTSSSITDYKDFQGDGNSLVDFNRSVTYTIKDIDTRFKYIQHIAIIYTNPDVYTIYNFDEQIINPSGETTVTCSSITDAIIINPVEFNLLSSGFKVAKDLEVKNRRLIAANTKTTNFDVTFDARAYRFDSGQVGRIYDASGGFIDIDGTAPDYNIAEDHDAINAFNSEQSGTWTADQYMYQADGTTIGGSGINVSYSFVSKELPSSFTGTGITYDSPHVNVDKWGASSGPESIGVTNFDGSNQDIVRDNQFKNNAGAYNTAFYRGYARGETYRFGIVFYDKKGSPSFVKWIGDIKMPEPTDGFPIQDYIGGVPYLFSLGIEFNVDISSIRSQISAFEIVRVHRREEDKTRLGSGGLMMFSSQGLTMQPSPHLTWSIANGFALTWGGGAAADIYGITDAYGFHLYDRLGLAESSASVDIEKDRLTWLLSPIGQLNSTFTHKSGDYTKTTGYYRSKCTRYHASAAGPPNKTFGFYYKALDFVSLPHNREWYQINKARILNVGEYIPAETDIIPNPYTYNAVPALSRHLRNSSFAKTTAPDVYSIVGLGSRKLAMIYADATDITIAENDGDPAGNWLWEAGGLFYNNTFTGAVDEEDQDSWFKEVLYCRAISNQYGGNTHVDRSLNVYMSTGHYQLVNANTFTFKAYGGDVFVNYYDDEYITWYNNRADAYLDPYNDPTAAKMSIAAVMPCETPINYNYRAGKRWASHRDGTSMSTFNIADYFYNFVFSQQNNTELKFYAKDAVRDFSEEQPHRLWASEPKLDGELIDSWRQFKTNNITEVNGIHGPINRLVNFRDRLFFYQDKAFGIASVDDQAVITDESGQTMILGTGGVFPNYGYISVNTGVIHQLAVAATEQALYHFDARLKKFFKYTEGTTPLSDVKGMSSWFANEIQGSIRDTDLLTITDATGIVAIPDYRYNRVLFTFLNNKPVAEDSEPVFGANSFTISYNEIIDAFESFYDYKPALYLNNGRRLLSVNPYDNNSVYEHNVGDYCKYYDQPESRSTLNLLLADKGLITKIYNNLAYKSELYDTNNQDIYDETFNRLRFYNEYQDTGLINLNDTNIKRRIRTWHHTIGRDKDHKLSRMRNPWLQLLLEFDNNNDKRIILHELAYNYIIAEY